MKIDNESIGVIFIIILAIFPRMVHQGYNTMLGRLLLIGVVLYFSVMNITLGLLMALVIMGSSNQFNPFVEGMTIGDDNEEKEKPKKEVGVDKEDIKIAVMSKNSNSIPVIAESSDEVNASTESMLGSSKLEGFASI